MVEDLPRAEDLASVIEQVQSGLVDHLCSKYGPSKGKPAHKCWATLKGKVSKRKRTAEVLRDDFEGDLENFLSFFTVRVPGGGTASGMKRKREEVTYRSYRRIVEKINHLTRDIETEKLKAQYRDGLGNFRMDCWKEKWGNKNRWEVWRELGLEAY